MSKLTKLFSLALLSFTLVAVPAVAQNHPDNHTYVQHKEWKKGARIQQQDWNRGDKIDYRQEHLPKPANGHEWREIDGNYVLCDQNGTIVEVRRAPHP
jgi:Ni/Co efflux regulator RcnB